MNFNFFSYPQKVFSRSQVADLNFGFEERENLHRARPIPACIRLNCLLKKDTFFSLAHQKILTINFA